MPLVHLKTLNKLLQLLKLLGNSFVFKKILFESQQDYLLIFRPKAEMYNKMPTYFSRLVAGATHPNNQT